jgi:hypothetical protein
MLKIKKTFDRRRFLRYLCHLGLKPFDTQIMLENLNDEKIRVVTSAKKGKKHMFLKHYYVGILHGSSRLK